MNPCISINHCVLLFSATISNSPVKSQSMKPIVPIVLTVAAKLKAQKTSKSFSRDVRILCLPVVGGSSWFD